MIPAFENIHLALVFGSSVLAALVLIPFIITLVKKRSWVDLPNERSSHIQVTPSMGGLSFLSALIMTLIFTAFDQEVAMLVACATIFMIMGALDDTRDLSAKLKLFVQMAIATVLYGSGLNLVDLKGFIGIGELPKIISFSLTIVLVAGVTNAFNLIDGVNGLAGGIGAINCLVFGLIFYFVDELAYATLFFAMAGALIGFLRYNFNPARIFMGDTGSLTVGILLAAGLLKVWAIGDSTLISLAVATIIFPCLDMLRLFVSRILNGASPFKADKHHFHHLLLKTGFDHVRTSVTTYIVQALLIVVALILGRNLSLTPALLITLLIACMTYALVEFRFYFKAQRAARNSRDRIAIEMSSNRLIRSLWNV